MPSIADILTQNSNDKVEIKSQVNLNGQAFKVFKQFTEVINAYEQATKIKTRNLSSGVSIYGNITHATYGTSKYNDSYINSFGTSRVIPPNRTFTERFMGTEFINLSSTATISGDTANFTSGEYLESKIIYKNEETLPSATLTSTEVSGSFDYGMKATSDSKLPVAHYKMNDDLANTIVLDSAGSDNLTASIDTDGLSVTGKMNKAFEFNGVLSGNHLEAHYKLNDDLATTNVIDSSGSYNGTLNGGNNTEDISVSGKINKAFEFNGSSDSVDLDDSSNFIPSLNSPISIAFWINPKAISGSSLANRIINFHRGAGAGSALAIAIGDNNKIQFYNHTDTSTTNWENTISVDTWYHIILTYDGTNFQKYFNGELDGSPIAKSLTAGGSYHAKIGTHSGLSTFFEGLIDSVMIYNCALTFGEAKAIYADGNGTENRTSLAGSSYSDSNDKSFSFWYNQNTNPSGDRMGRMGNIYHFCNSSGKIKISYKKQSGGYSGSNSTSAGSNNTWHHCVTTFTQNGSNTDVKIYIDGVLDVDQTITGNRNITDTDVYIGQSDSINYFRGKLDDIRVYNSVLIQADVDVIHNSGRGSKFSDAYFESVTNGAAHTFINSGEDLKYIAEENDSSTGEISKITVTV